MPHHNHALPEEEFSEKDWSQDSSDGEWLSSEDEYLSEGGEDTSHYAQPESEDLPEKWFYDGEVSDD